MPNKIGDWIGVVIEVTGPGEGNQFDGPSVKALLEENMRLKSRILELQEALVDAAVGPTPKADVEKPMPRHLVPGAYAIAYALMVPVARKHGYALTIHGSLVRDLDCVAIPWTLEAVDPEILVKDLADSIGWMMRDDKGEPGKKPHGRLAYTILEHESGMWVDLAVIPPSTQPPSQEKP